MQWRLFGSRVLVSENVARNVIHRCRSVIAILFLSAAATACAADPSFEEHNKKLCGEFHAQLKSPEGLSSYAVAGKEVEEGVWEITGFDVDGDKVADKIVRSCPGSASLIPADPCTLEFVPSAVGEPFAFEESRLYVFEYKSHLYVVAGGRDTEDGPDHIGIYDFTSSGIRRLCFYEK